MLGARSRRPLRRILLIAVAAAVGSTACGSQAGDGNPSGSGPGTIRMAVQQQNFATIPLTLSEDLGYFQDENLTLETTIGQSTSTMTAGLLGGSFDVQIGGAELLAAREQGAPLIAIAGMCNSAIWSVIAKPEISDLEDLRGRTIATSGPDSVSTVALVASLKHVGLQPDDYQQITAGGTAERFVAVQKGQADATVVTSPLEFQASEQGLRNLGSLYDALPGFVSGFVVTSKTYAAEHGATLDRFSRVWVRTLRWMHDPANEDDLVKRVASILDTPEPVVRQAYAYWLTGKRADAMFPADGKIDTEALASSADAFVDNGSLRSPGDALKDFVVEDYIDQAQEVR